VGVGIMAPPITYSVDGTQYVAVVAGLGGAHGGHFTKFVNANEGQVLALKLGGKASLPKSKPRVPGKVEAPAQAASSETIDHGRSLYARMCISCHGGGAESSGLRPDLRFSKREVHDSWSDIVLGGTKQGGGMASFADQLTRADSDAIHAYVISRAHHRPSALERLARWVGGYACIPADWMAH